MTEEDVIQAIIREGWIFDEETGLVSKGENRDLKPREAYYVEFGEEANEG